MTEKQLQKFFQSLPAEKQNEINFLYARHAQSSRKIGIEPSTPLEFLRDCYYAMQSNQNALQIIPIDSSNEYESRDYIRQMR